MDKDLDIVALGELLIDFTPYGQSNEGNVLFEQNPGGAPANALVAATRFGAKTAFIGKVGDDQFGHYLKGILDKVNIGTSGLVFTKDANTTLAFVHLNPDGDRSFSFYRKPGADILIEVEDLNKDLINKAKVFHFGSISLTHEPARSTTIHAIQHAKQNGALISYDPNWRPGLWKTHEESIRWMKKGIEYADIVKVSEEELELITGEEDLEKGSNILAQRGVKVVFVTLGTEGCYYRIKGGTGHVAAFKVPTIDTTGAGDSFFGSMLYQIIEANKKLEDLTKVQMDKYVEISNATAALCVQKKGAIPGIPLRKQVKEFMETLPTCQ